MPKEANKKPDNKKQDSKKQEGKNKKHFMKPIRQRLQRKFLNVN